MGKERERGGEVKGQFDEASGRVARSPWIARLARCGYAAKGVVYIVAGGLAVLAVIGFGVYQLYKSYSAKFRKRLKLSSMSEGARKWATLSGRVGYAARGTIFIVVGVLLMRVARTYNPAHARGLDGALQLLARTPFGHYLLFAVAAGLAAYGVYTLVEARYRRIAGS